MPRVSVGLHELPTTPHFLYRFFDRTDALLYIGITNDPKARFKWHRKYQPWWSDVDQSRTRIDYHPTRESALDAERKAIVAESPLYNDQHNLTVDTPTNKAIADALRSSADTLLHHMCSDGEEYEDALQEGRRAVEDAEAEDPGEDELAGQDPVLVAAELKAMNLSSNAFQFRHGLEDFLGVLPDEDVARWMDAARTWAKRNADEYDEASTEDEILRQVLRFAAMEAASEYLATLPSAEADEWRAGARNGTNPWATAGQIDLRAAEDAKAYKIRGRRGFRMCNWEGKHGAACPDKATISFVYENCPICEPEACKGHLETCVGHQGCVQSQSWVKTQRPVVVLWSGVKSSSDDPWGF